MARNGGLREWAALGGLMALGLAAGARADGPTSALTIELVRPDRQLERLLALFEGTKAQHPAAALAAWRAGSGRFDMLGKGPQAALAALNPDMVPEFRNLDGARIFLRIDAEGRPRWSLAVPRDDGTLGALATALVLTDGAAEPPLAGGGAVDRLGPPGSPLMARAGEAVAVAADRQDLAAALEGLESPGPKPEGLDTGVVARLDPKALARSADLMTRRIAAALVALGVDEVHAIVALEGDALNLTVRSPLERPGRAPTAIDPAWLDGIPAEGVAAAFALTVEPGTGSLERLFALADAIEKADPARADVAPLRARLNLLANLAGVRPEVELWPALRGISGFVRTDEAGQFAGLVVALHARDEATARRLAGRALPRLVGLPTVEEGTRTPAEGEAGRVWHGFKFDRPLVIETKGSATVWVAWGFDPEPGSLVALGRPGSVGPTLRTALAGREASRFAAAWPARTPLPGLGPAADSPIAAALLGAPPVVWVGTREGDADRDEVRWDGLGASLARLLDRLPLEEPRP